MSTKEHESINDDEQDSEIFRQSLLALCDEFSEFLSEKYARKTVRKHVSIIELFVDFIDQYTEAKNISEITKGMVNTQFRKWWKRKVWDSSSENDLRVALNKFFNFLADRKNIVNDAVLKALK